MGNRNEYNRQWRLNNPEKVKAINERRRGKGKEKRIEWIKANPEKVKEYKKREREKNKERYSNYGKKWREENKEYIRQCSIEYRKKNKIKIRIQKYGLTVDQYNNMMESQNHCCKICGKNQSEFNKMFAVDHNHETNEVRGLLCTNCNLIIGLCYENPEILLNSIEYLTEI